MSDEKGQPGLLYPFWHDTFARGVLIGLVPALLASVIARAPQNRLSKVLGQDLGIPADAIVLILAAPVYFLIITWLLKRAGQRAGRCTAAWNTSDIAVLRGLVALLALTAVFLLSQFFLILAPVGTCDLRPRFDLLWFFSLSDHQIEHCMGSAKVTNDQAWWYFRPVIVQAWLYVVLIVMSLRFLWEGWKEWLKCVDLRHAGNLRPYRED